MVETAARQTFRPPQDFREHCVRWIGMKNLPAGGADLLSVLRCPERLASLSLREWDSVIPLARFVGLLPQIASLVRRLEFEDRVPPQVQCHLRSAEIAAASRETEIRWELDCLKSALVEAGLPVILLKGVAFLLLDFDFARGRRFCDVDLLVPKASLPNVEAALRKCGWVDVERSPLHVEYYRTWLQEIAPMWHPERKIQVDIHYTIIPPKDRIPFDPSSLFERAVPLGAVPFHALAPTDLFLHATTNLFRTGDFVYLLRDLWDMHEILQRFGTQPDFWQDLVQRAPALRLQQPCYLALRYLQTVFEVPVPQEVVTAMESWRPNAVFLRLVDACVRRCLFPRILTRVDSGRNLVLWLRDYWPLPRFRAYCSYLFWRKRLPVGRKNGDRDVRQEKPQPDHDREPAI